MSAKINWCIERNEHSDSWSCDVILRDGGKQIRKSRHVLTRHQLESVAGDVEGFLWRLFAELHTKLLGSPGIHMTRYGADPKLRDFPMQRRQFSKWLVSEGMMGGSKRTRSYEELAGLLEYERKKLEIESLKASYGLISSSAAGAWVPTAPGSLTYYSTLGAVILGPSPAPAPPKRPDSVEDDPELGLVVHTYENGTIVLLKDPDSGQQMMLKPEQFDFIRAALTRVKAKREAAKLDETEDEDEDEMVF